MVKPAAKPEEEEEEMPEEQAFLTILKSSYYGIGNRTKLDRYREFRHIFLGSNEGKRVLSEILGMAKLSARLAQPYPAPVDEKRLLIQEGARQLAADILDVIHKEPSMDKPVVQNRRRK